MRDTRSARQRRRDANTAFAADAERQMSEWLREREPPRPADVCPVQKYGEHHYITSYVDGRRYCLHCLKEPA